MSSPKKPTQGQIVIEVDVLAKAMKHGASIVESRDVIPILGNVRLVAEGETLEVVTSDSEVEFRQRLPLKQGAPSAGSGLATTVDARRFQTLTSLLESGAQVGLKIDGGHMLISSGRGRWRMPVLPASDFPMLEFAEDPPALTVGGEALAGAIGRVEWAVSINPTKPYLHGPLLHEAEGKAALVGADGNILIVTPMPADWPRGAGQVILGAKYARTLQRLAGEIGGDVELAWDERKVRARLGTAEAQTTLTGKTIDATFPDYRRIIPAPIEQPLVLEPGALRSALQRVSLMADGRSRAIAFEREDGKVTLAAQTAEAGSGAEDIEVDGPAGGRTGFNITYLDRMVEAIGGETIAFHQETPGHGARIERMVSDGAIGVVMPMSV